MSTLCKFESGTGNIPSCPFLQADKAKAAKAKLNKAPKRTAGHDPHGSGLITPDTKRQRGLKPGDITPSGDDLNGMLVYTGTNMDRQRDQPLLAPLRRPPARGPSLPPRCILHDDP